DAGRADAEAGTPLLALGRVILSAAPPGDEDARDEAVHAWLEALGRQPRDARVQALLWDQAGRDYGRAWRSDRALGRSLRIQEALVEASPDDVLAWANLGNTRRVAGHLEAALQAYDAARRLDPGDAAVASDRGLVLSALGRKDEALAAFEDAAQLDPAYTAARQNAARLLWLRGKDDEAAHHLAAALRQVRSMGEGPGLYRFLLDRTWRTRHRKALR
ncbi:MAG: tetratricopeptide repeat protein, partial [Planctomycetota bacterium]